MGDGLILAIDQGTTNTKALLVDRSGAPVFRASAAVSLIRSDSGHLEQDPLHLWNSVKQVIEECAAYASQCGASIEALAISNQRETAVAWDAVSNAPIGNAISWQCPRSEAICQRLEVHSDAIRSRTGLPLATLISAGKWAWLLENDAHTQAAARPGNLRFGTVDSWLVNRLTCGSVHYTDLSNASRTGLLNLDERSWDVDLLELFGIPRESMPDLRPSSGFLGECSDFPGIDGVPSLTRHSLRLKETSP
jgi:glycerol kinase